MRRWILALAVALSAAIGMAACGETEEGTTPITPTPTTVAKTEAFTGTVASAETKIHTFVVQPGKVTATLTALGPDGAVPIGLGVGTWDTVSCNAVVVNGAAIQGNSLVGTASSATTLCVKVYDVGNLTDTAATYTVTVEYQVTAS